MAVLKGNTLSSTHRGHFLFLSVVAFPILTALEKKKILEINMQTRALVAQKGAWSPIVPREQLSQAEAQTRLKQFFKAPFRRNTLFCQR